VSDSLLEIVDALRAYADWQSAMRAPTAFESRALAERSFEDRRAHVRLRPIQLDRPMLARLKPGPLLTLIDVSAGGALIQTPTRLTPGAHVLIEFLAPGTRRATVLRSRIMRSQVAALEGCVRYRGACSFDETLELGYFLPSVRANGDERHTAPLNYEVFAAASTSLTTGPAPTQPGIAELLEDVNRMRTARASRSALVRHVDEWLRRRVPLLGVRVNPVTSNRLRAGDVLSFKLPVATGSSRTQVCIEFQPACALDEHQRQLLEAGACLMSSLITQSPL
jgi:hypothetical protein